MSSETAASGADRPFYFIVAFWGEVYCDYFLRLCLPALLSPGNVPSLGRQAKLIVVTTVEDWAATIVHPTFALARGMIEPVHIEIAPPNADDNKMNTMSAAHCLASDMAFADKALGVFLTPDLVLSDGSGAALARLAGEGRKVVLCGAVRFAWERFIPEMERTFGLRPGEPLVLPSRELTGMALRHLHSETKTYVWDDASFSTTPYACLFRVADGSGYVVHSFSWAPLLVDYGALASHDTDTFDEWTLDGDYVHRNFPNPDDVYVVRDSDEIMLVSFTKEAELHFRLWPHWLYLGPWRDWCKVQILAKLYHGATVDPLKRNLFAQPVRWHGGEVTKSWVSTERRAAELLRQAVETASFNDYVFIAVRLGTFRAVLSFMKFARKNKKQVAEGMVSWVLDGFVKSWLDRLRRPLPRSGGPWRAAFGLISLGLQAMLPPLRRQVIAGGAPRPPRRILCHQLSKWSCRTFVIGPRLASGRWYWEIRSGNLGAADDTVRATGAFGVVAPGADLVAQLGGDGRGWGWQGDGTLHHDGTSRPYGKPVIGAPVVVMVAFDADAGRVWFGLDGTWFDDGAPEQGTGAAFDDVNHPAIPAVMSRHGGNGTAVLELCMRREEVTHAPPQGFRPLREAF